MGLLQFLTLAVTDALPHGGRAPAKIVRAPAKLTGLFMLKIEKDQMPTLCVPWRLEQTAESHSLLSLSLIHISEPTRPY